MHTSLHTDDMPPLPTTWQHTRVTVMGLGSFGGGVGLTRYLGRQGAHVTVTDLQGTEALAAPLGACGGLPSGLWLGDIQGGVFLGRVVGLFNPRSPSPAPSLQ